MCHLISVIVPVYNAADFICRCVDSILAQTYNYWELILVDDGSFDNSSAICDEYVGQDCRIKVIHKLNGGVTSARLAGINMSQGEYLCFLDADDVFLPSALSSMYARIEDDIDVVVPDMSVYEIFTCERYVKDLLTNTIPWGVVGKLFRRDLFNHKEVVISSEFNIGEDLLMQLSLAQYLTKKIVLSNDRVYRIIGNPNSATRTRVWSVEYELKFISEVINAVGNLKFNLSQQIFHLRMQSLKGLVINSVPVDYRDSWFIQLRNDSLKYQLTTEEKLLLNVKDGLMAKCLLTIKDFLWRIRNKQWKNH